MFNWLFKHCYLFGCGCLRLRFVGNSVDCLYLLCMFLCIGDYLGYDCYLVVISVCLCCLLLLVWVVVVYILFWCFGFSCVVYYIL